VFNVPEPKTVGYGFDDGPNCTHNAFYDYLSSQNQKATMFFIGSNVLIWPREARRALTDGHEICVREFAFRFWHSI
jgi:peptidoglycan/xylan/chitin deacetylase (PgdA/CDA1 family)